MFSDLVGSTALSASMDPEDLREIISAYQKCVAETVHRFDGFVARYMGDGVLVYFGYPQAHEDDAERAVRAGLELITAVTALKTRASLQTRVGIATGLVVVGDLIGSGASQERGIVGETPNLAARLQGIAEPNTVVICRQHAQASRQSLRTGGSRAQGPQGHRRPMRAWAALRASSVASRFEALHAMRLDRLGRARRRTRIAAAALVQGKERRRPGSAALRRSRDRQITAHGGVLGMSRWRAAHRLRYFCSPQHTDSALYPIIGQMERAAGLAHDDTPQAKLDKLDALLKQTSTSAQDAALIAEMLSLPNDGRYPDARADPATAPAKNVGSTGVANGSSGALQSGADGLRGCALDRPHQPGTVRSDRGPDSDTEACC